MDVYSNECVIVLAGKHCAIVTAVIVIATVVVTVVVRLSSSLLVMMVKYVGVCVPGAV